MTSEEIWTPDTVIREDAGANYFSEFKDTQIRIHSNGLHYWTRLGDMKVSASLDFTKYPYDIQKINMTIGSWLYNDQRITYEYYKDRETGKPQQLMIQNPDNWYTDNIEWDFASNYTEDIVLSQSQGTFKYKRFIVHIKREGGTMLVGMIVPGQLVALLGSLYYLLPRGNGSRVSYLATIMLTEIMFLVMVTQVVPQYKNIPAIAILFLEETIMLSFLMIFVLLMDKIQTVHNQTIAEFQKKAG